MQQQVPAVSASSVSSALCQLAHSLGVVLLHYDGLDPGVFAPASEEAELGPEAREVSAAALEALRTTLAAALPAEYTEWLVLALVHHALQGGSSSDGLGQRSPSEGDEQVQRRSVNLEKDIKQQLSSLVAEDTADASAQGLVTALKLVSLPVQSPRVQGVAVEVIKCATQLAQAPEVQQVGGGYMPD
jgi:hypothetical protein